MGVLELQKLTFECFDAVGVVVDYQIVFLDLWLLMKGKCFELGIFK